MFYVSTTWKHENEINEKQMQQLLASFKGTNPNVREVHWWKVDNFTHGALVIYNFKDHNQKRAIEACVAGTKTLEKPMTASEARIFCEKQIKNN